MFLDRKDASSALPSGTPIGDSSNEKAANMQKEYCIILIAEADISGHDIFLAAYPSRLFYSSVS